MSNAYEQSMQLAFERWYGFEVNEDMDIATQIAWENWKHKFQALEMYFDMYSHKKSNPTRR